MSVCRCVGVCKTLSECVHLSLGVAGAVLDAQHDVQAGAAAGALLQQTATLQRRHHAGQCPVAHTPRLTEAVDLLLTSAC